MPTLSVFVSSPSDVALEREITRKALDQLGHEFRREVTLKPYFWEYEPQDFSQGYQPQIPKASTYDIVICIFFSRIGKPLTIDGQTYPSGSAYELLEAKAGKVERIKRGESPLPHILVFVNQTDPQISIRDKSERERRIKSWDALKEFLDEHTKDGDEYIGAVNHYHTVKEFETKVELKIRRLIEEHLAHPDRASLEAPSVVRDWQQGNPYRGLLAFEFEHAKVFFGRSTAAAGVIQAFQNQVAEGRPRFVMILGASGSGKSSLARAGVLPTLVTPGVIEGVGYWRRAVMRPSGADNSTPSDAERASSADDSPQPHRSEFDLFRVLSQALLAPNALPELMDDQTTRESLAERLRDKSDAAVESIRGALRQAAAMEKERQSTLLTKQIGDYEAGGRHEDAKACRDRLEHGLTPPVFRLVLLVDQLEELFTGNFPRGQVASFTQCLRKLAESDSPVFVVATLPSDFYVNVAEDEHLADLMTHQGSHFPLPAPTDAELIQMIRLPALAAGLRFDARDGVSLDEQLLSDARSNPDCLPLLEFCLEQLAERGKDQGRLMFADYDALGNLAGVLAETAEETLKGLEREQTISSRKDLDLILQSLINRDPNQPKAAVRRAAPWKEVTATSDAEHIVNAFVKARLLVRQGSTNSDAGELHQPNHDEQRTAEPPRFVSVAHEALLRNWEPAKKWIGLDENQQFLQKRERLERSYREWLDGDKHSRYLLQTEIDLAEAKDLITRHPQAFQDMRDYVQASVRRRRIRRYSAVSAFLALLSFAAIFSIWSLRQQANAALAGQLVAQADRSLAQRDFATAEIVSAKALTIQDSPETRLQLMRARSGGVRLVGTSRQAFPDARLTAFSHGGDLGAVVRAAGSQPGCTVTLFRTSDWNELASFPLDYVPECLKLNQSDKSTRLLACSRPAPYFDIELWAVNLPAHQAQLYRKLDKPHAKRIPTIAFHPSRPWLADGSEDQTLRLWDYAPETPKLLGERPKAHGTNIHGIAFNHDGSLLASGGGDYRVKIWKIQDPDHHPLAVLLPGLPNLVKLCKIPWPDLPQLEVSKESPVVLEGHVDSVFAVAFSPDGERLASSGYERVIRIWNLANNSKENTLEGHEGTVLDLVFTEDKLLASGGKDETVRLWHVSQGRILTTLRPQCGVIRSVACRRFGADVFCGGESGSSIWSHRERPEAGRLWNGGATVNVIAYDPLEEYLAAGGTDGNIRLWDRKQQLVRTLETGLDGEAINGMAFDPLGRWLAAGGEGKTVHVWDRKHDWQKLDVQLTHGGPVWGMCFDPQGRWLASSNSDDDICIKKWDATDWSLIATFGKSDHSIYALACYADQQGTRLVSGDADAHVIVRDAETGIVIAEKTNVTEGERNVWSVAIGADPLSIITGNSDGRARRWLPDSRQDPVATSLEDSHVNPTINSVSYSKKHQWIGASGDGPSVEIYDRNMKHLLSLVGQDASVWWVTFDSEGDRLAYGGIDGIVRCWNIKEVQQTRLRSSPAQLFQASQQATGLTVEHGKVVPFLKK